MRSLQTVTRRKKTLLGHIRAQRDKQNKSKRISQQTSSSESEDERKLKQKNAEITNALELETTARNKAKMMCRKMKKQNMATVAKLQEAMEQVTEDRSRLEKSLIESEESMYVRRIRSNVTPTAIDNQILPATTGNSEATSRQVCRHQQVQALSR